MTEAAIFIYLKWKQSGPQCSHPHGTGSPFCPKFSRKTKFYKKYFPQFLGHHKPSLLFKISCEKR